MTGETGAAAITTSTGAEATTATTAATTRWSKGAPLDRQNNNIDNGFVAMGVGGRASTGDLDR